MTRRERRESNAIRSLVARAMGLSYGPSECRREDADEYLSVSQHVNAVEETATVPVQWVMTRNRKILETVPRPVIVSRLRTVEG